MGKTQLKTLYAMLPIFAVISASNSTLLAQENDTIIVTGKTLDQTLAGLNECIKNACAPDKDIDATLAHAENLFVSGEYKQASLIIGKSVKRNKKFASQYPVAVSDLYRSSGRVYEHIGEVRDARFATLNMRDTLKKHMPEDRARILAAEIEVANSRFKQGFFDEAKRKYRSIRKSALADGYKDIAGIAKIRELSLDASRAGALKNIYFVNKARKNINKFINEADQDVNFKTAAMIILARLDRTLGVETSTDELIATLIKTNDSGRPVLVSTDPVTLNIAALAKGLGSSNASNSITRFNTERFSSVRFEDRWVDIGFWVNNDGTVDEAEILRIRGDNNWVDNVTKSIVSRIYVPKKDKVNGETLGQYVIERYTLTSKFNTQTTGTRIRTRDGIPIVRRLDLTVYDDEAAEEVDSAS